MSKKITCWSLFIIYFLCNGITLQAQSFFQPIAENQEVTDNGFVLGYRIMSERERSVGKQGVQQRYEVRLSVTNVNSNFANQPFTEFIQGKTKLEAPILVEISCRNATGARLTSKKVDFSAKVKYLEYRRKRNPSLADDVASNWETIRVPTGYFWDIGERQESTVVFLVPKGEAPELEFRVNTF